MPAYSLVCALAPWAMGRPLNTPLVLLTWCVLVASATQSTVLVLLDDASLAESHSRFLGGLRAQGHELDVQPIDDASLRLARWGDWIYDKLVILGGRKGEGAKGKGGEKCGRHPPKPLFPHLHAVCAARSAFRPPVPSQA